MEISIIRTEQDYEAALKEIESLLEKTGQDDSDKLELLSIVVENYENTYYKIDSPDLEYQKY